METWSTHQLYRRAEKHHDAETARALQDYAQALSKRGLPVVFSLGHLAMITGVSYLMLWETVKRRRETANYRMYAVKKRSGGRRFIHAVSTDLFRVHQFINQAILQANPRHPCSFAFHSSGGIRACASMHCNSRWLFQYDLKDFFYDVTEIDVYRAFRDMGYRDLLSFELARLCTTTHLPKWQGRLLYHQSKFRPFAPSIPEESEPRLPYADRSGNVGVLPQGAATSPMLSNIAAAELDASLYDFSTENGFTYTRYADDITISAATRYLPLSTADIHRSIVQRIRRARFRENEKKFRVAGPGSKKIVLGLLVDGDVPRLSKETYQRIDRHLHAASKFGLEDTARHESFDSAFGFYNHLTGLVAFVKDVDTERWEEFSSRLAVIPVPWE